MQNANASVEFLLAMNLGDLRAAMAKMADPRTIRSRLRLGVATSRPCLVTMTVGFQPAHFQRFKSR
jgi:hypothetical protein